MTVLPRSLRAEILAAQPVRCRLSFVGALVVAVIAGLVWL